MKLVEFATNGGDNKPPSTVTNLVNAAGVSPSQAPVAEILRVDLYGTSVLLEEFGKVTSLDPVALDQACLDKVFNYQGKPGDDNKPLIERINRQHGTYITDYAEQIGFGSKKYILIYID